MTVTRWIRKSRPDTAAQGLAGNFERQEFLVRSSTIQLAKQE
jgi:hypothetical protein